MPAKLQIARYWADRGSIPALDINIPACFACRKDAGSNWAQARLQRAHLIPWSSGGANDASNLVLLCDRCHKDAPMVSISQKPMLDWVNRREWYFIFLMRRVAEECNAVNREMVPALCAAFDTNALAAKFDSAMRAIGAYPHPGGDPAASAAVAVKSIYDFGMPA